MVAGLHLIEDDLEHQIGPKGLGPDPGIGGEQGRPIESVDRLVDDAGEMVGRQGVLDLEPSGGGTIPGGRGEAPEFGTIPVRWRAEHREEVADATGTAPAEDGPQVEAAVSWVKGS